MYMLPAVRSRIHVVVAGVVAALVGLSVFFPSVVSTVIGSTRIVGDRSTEFSDTGRVEVLEQGLEDFYTSPIFGIGVQYIAEAHTLYVGVLAAGGVIFGFGFVLFNIGSLRTSVQAVKVDRSLGGALLETTLVASLGYWTVADLIRAQRCPPSTGSSSPCGGGARATQRGPHRVRKQPTRWSSRGVGGPSRRAFVQHERAHTESSR